MSSNTAALKEWLKEHRITEVELMVADMAAIARGKILPTNKFLAGLDNDTLRLPESVFGQMVTGADAETKALSAQSPDMILAPDADTICIVPWYREPTAPVLCDCLNRKGEPIQYAPRQVLKNVLKLYADKGNPDGRKRDARPIRSTRSTSSIRCSRTSTIFARARRSASIA